MPPTTLHTADALRGGRAGPPVKRGSLFPTVGTAQQTCPIDDGHRGAMLRDRGGNVGLGLVIAALAPDDQPDMRGHRLAKSEQPGLAFAAACRHIQVNAPAGSSTRRIRRSRAPGA
jgi:hypothetical protein